jgi:hypothetical protein
MGKVEKQLRKFRVLWMFPCRTNTDSKWRHSPTRKSACRRYPFGRCVFKFKTLKPRRLRLSAAVNNREADGRRADFSFAKEARYVG